MKFLCFLVILFMQYIHTFTYGESHKLKFQWAPETPETSSRQNVKYLFYEVNPPEGFNLRRDVYIRMAVLASRLQEIGNWVLVLPPWPHLYHWTARIAQDRVPWSYFFNVDDLNKFTPVIEMMDFLDVHPDGVIDHTYILQNFVEMFKTGKFVDKYEIKPCVERHNYVKETPEGYIGTLPELTSRKLDCLSFHGTASFITPLLGNSAESKILLDHAEILLHDHYGDERYWRARRSMRFSKNLETIAADFRKVFLNDTSDASSASIDWRDQKPHRSATGGDYLAVHLRRKDFLHARRSEIPSLKGAVEQIKTALNRLKLKTVFVATDAPQKELEDLKKLCIAGSITFVSFRPSEEMLHIIKDGGTAIIDQIICSHARMFIGSHESTFSLRIQEEREILGFPPETTFNRLCGDKEPTCTQPSKWLIRY